VCFSIIRLRLPTAIAGSSQRPYDIETSREVPKIINDNEGLLFDYLSEQDQGNISSPILRCSRPLFPKFFQTSLPEILQRHYDAEFDVRIEG